MMAAVFELLALPFTCSKAASAAFLILADVPLESLGFSFCFKAGGRAAGDDDRFALLLRAFWHYTDRQI